MGEFDVPAILDYVTTATEQERVPVVGHSMGNTMMMVMGSLRPEYNRLVSVHVALAPTVFLQHAQSPILKGFAALAPTVSVSACLPERGPRPLCHHDHGHQAQPCVVALLQTLTAMLGVHGLRPTLPLNESLKQLCREEAVLTQRLCKHAAFMLLGFDPEQLNVVSNAAKNGGKVTMPCRQSQATRAGDTPRLRGSFDEEYRQGKVRHAAPRRLQLTLSVRCATLCLQTTFPAILGHFPSGGSTRTLLHYVQSFTSGDFRQYDHGAKRNMLKYGQPSPPAYNVSLVDFPVAISVGDNDWLDSVEVSDEAVSLLLTRETQDLSSSCARTRRLIFSCQPVNTWMACCRTWSG